MLSNPCQVNREKFTYEGGKYLYHVSPHDSGLPDFRGHMFCNVVFFADDERHARDVFKRCLQFMMKDKESLSYEFVKSIFNQFDKLRFVRAPTDQLYVVGWADNDTL